MVRFRSSLVAPVLCAALSSTARGSEQLSSEVRIVETSVGNHGTLAVRYSEGDFKTVTIEMINSNGCSAIYTWIGQRDEITIKSESGETRLKLSADPEKFSSALRKMRDFIAYASGPERYEWLVFGSDVVAPELNQLISSIDQALGTKSSHDVNCQLLIERDGVDPLVVSGGAYGDLGSYSKSVTKVWVKKGYTLVLVSNPHFDTEHDVKLVRVLGDERRATTELPVSDYGHGFSQLVRGVEGTTYTLSGSQMEGAVQSFICRPDLRD